MNTVRGRDIALVVLLVHLILAFVSWSPFFEWFYANIITLILSILVITMFKNVRIFIFQSFNMIEFRKSSIYVFLLLFIILFYIFGAVYNGRGIDFGTTWNYLTLPYSEVPDNTVNKLILFSIGLVIIRPLIEEIVYRILIQGYLQLKFNKWVSLFISTIIFGVLHFDRMIEAGVHGFVYSFLFMKYKSIYPALILHMLWNVYAIYYFNYI